MGTIAARDCLRVIELTQQVCAATVLACVQGVELRQQRGDLIKEQLTPAVQEFCSQIRQVSDFVDEDRPLEKDLKSIIQLINQEHWNLYPQ